MERDPQGNLVLEPQEVGVTKLPTDKMIYPVEDALLVYHAAHEAETELKERNLGGTYLHRVAGGMIDRLVTYALDGSLPSSIKGSIVRAEARRVQAQRMAPSHVVRCHAALTLDRLSTHRSSHPIRHTLDERQHSMRRRRALYWSPPPEA